MSTAISHGDNQWFIQHCMHYPDAKYSELQDVKHGRISCTTTMGKQCISVQGIYIIYTYLYLYCGVYMMAQLGLGSLFFSGLSNLPIIEIFIVHQCIYNVT